MAHDVPVSPTHSGVTPDRKTASPALRQTGSAINTRNTWCIIFTWYWFDNKQHVFSKLLRIVSVIISMLEDHNAILLSLHLEVGTTAFCPLCVIYFSVSLIVITKKLMTENSRQDKFSHTGSISSSFKRKKVCSKCQATH